MRTFCKPRSTEELLWIRRRMFKVGSAVWPDLVEFDLEKERKENIRW
jgi:hypothetical protein